MVTGCHRNAPIVEKLRAQGEGQRREKRETGEQREAGESQVEIVLIVIIF